MPDLFPVVKKKKKNGINKNTEKSMYLNPQALDEVYLHSRNNCQARLICLFLTVGLI